MELWVPFCIGAAFFQSLRSALQRHMRRVLSNNGATYIRFCYAAPLAVLYVAGLGGAGLELPHPNGKFVAFAVSGSLCQIGATALLLYLFSLRNFAVGTTYSKTETIQTALLGLVLLGDALTVAGLIGILVSLVGVITLSAAGLGLGASGLLLGLGQRPALVGLASGALFGLSAVSYRAAALALGGEGFLMQAAFTLACVTVFQTAVMSLYLRWREPGQVTLALRSWRVAGLAGAAGMLASVGWFTAMTLQNAAYVKALGQVELLFAFAASHLFFGERSTRLELGGILLVVAGIIILLLLG